MRLVLRAGFDRFSGYGNDAVDLAVNLQKVGVDVVPLPISLLPGLPRKFTRLLEKDPRGRKDVVMTFAPPYDIKPWEFAKMAPVAVGYSMWERTPLLPEDFDGHAWPHEIPEGVAPPVEMIGQMRAERFGTDGGPANAWDGLRHMFVTCPMNREAFAHVDEVTPTSVVPCGIEGKDWPVAQRDPKRRMRFLMVGMLTGRKEPFVMLDAWRELKQEHPEFDAVLTMHTMARGLHPKIAEAYPDVEISDRTLDRKGLLRLYHGSDVLVSTSRGEGNNKPAMEFMATGGTVIASDWSGHQNWLHRDVTTAVPGTLQPVPGQPKAQDFHVDTEALKTALLDAWRNPSDTARRGERAATWVREALSWDVVVRRMVSTLESL